MQNSFSEKNNGLTVAVIYKYYRQFHNCYVVHPIPIDKITAVSLYKKHKTVFDSVAEVFSKNNMEVKPYIKFFADNLGKTEHDIDTHLANPLTLTLYSEYIAFIKKSRQIMAWFDKSVKNIAEYCIAEHVSAVNGFRKLITTNSLSSWYISGKISKYWLAAIPGFDKAIDKLDYFSKLEFAELSKKYDLYNSEINRASMYCKNIKANPIKAVDDMIEKISAGLKN